MDIHSQDPQAINDLWGLSSSSSHDANPELHTPTFNGRVIPPPQEPGPQKQSETGQQHVDQPGDKFLRSLSPVFQYGHSHRVRKRQSRKRKRTDDPNSRKKVCFDSQKESEASDAIPGTPEHEIKHSCPRTREDDDDQQGSQGARMQSLETLALADGEKDELLMCSLETMLSNENPSSQDLGTIQDTKIRRRDVYENIVSRPPRKAKEMFARLAKKAMESCSQNSDSDDSPRPHWHIVVGDQVHAIETSLTLGRHRVMCDVQHGGAWASRFHVAFVRKGANLVVMDIGSRNGTRIQDSSGKRSWEIGDYQIAKHLKPEHCYTTRIGKTLVRICPNSDMDHCQPAKQSTLPDLEPTSGET